MPRGLFVLVNAVKRKEGVVAARGRGSTHGRRRGVCIYRAPIVACFIVKRATLGEEVEVGFPVAGLPHLDGCADFSST